AGRVNRSVAGRGAISPRARRPGPSGAARAGRTAQRVRTMSGAEASAQPPKKSLKDRLVVPPSPGFAGEGTGVRGILASHPLTPALSPRSGEREKMMQLRIEQHVSASDLEDGLRAAH